MNLPFVQPATQGPHLYFSGTVRERRSGHSPASGESPGGLPPSGGAWDFLGFLFNEAGVDISSYRPTVLLRRVPACLRALRAGTLEEARFILKGDPACLETAMDAVLLGVTEFFRDRDVFAFIETQILPRLLADAREPRIWSAACSTGQELYSTALLVERKRALGRVELLGTDCREDALRLAAGGIFGPPRKRMATGVQRLSLLGHALKVSENVRAKLQWRRGDLLRAAEPGPWDLILWRNMAIYLTPAAAHGVWHRLAAELRPGGYLVSGKAEHPPPGTGLVRVAPAVYHKPVRGGEA